MSSLYHHQTIQTNGIQLHVVTAGDPANEPVILLHGFPQFWYCWHHQIDYLALKGYYVIAPDQRGYNLSDKPSGVKNYHIDILTQDIIGLIETMGYQQVYLAGHDWGGIVAWWIATYHPHILKKCAILNVPHPIIFGQEIRQLNLQQLRRSWYIFFFQIPRLPEWIVSKNDWWDAAILRKSTHRNTFTEEDISRYKEAWNQPDAMRSMMNWYRAMTISFMKTRKPANMPIQVPMRLLWGEQDVALGKQMIEKSVKLCSDATLHYFPDASHWLMDDEADAVNQHLANFFQ